MSLLNYVPIKELRDVSKGFRRCLRRLLCNRHLQNFTVLTVHRNKDELLFFVFRCCSPPGLQAWAHLDGKIWRLFYNV